MVETINKILNLSLKLDPKLCILGVGGNLGNGRDKTKAVRRCLYQARKGITKRWQAEKPPSVNDWRRAVSETIGKERTVFVRAGNLKEF